MDSVINEMMFELSHEAIQEGKNAKLITERKTGIFFPQPNYMSYGTYNMLSNLWISYKNKLKEEIELNEASIQKMIVSLNEINGTTAALAAQGIGNAGDMAAVMMSASAKAAGGGAPVVNKNANNPAFHNNKKLIKAYKDMSQQMKQFLQHKNGTPSGKSAKKGGTSTATAASKGHGGGGGGKSFASVAEGMKNNGKKKGAAVADASSSSFTAPAAVAESKYEKAKVKKLINKLKRLELRRQERLCNEMLAEEMANRRFYQWELKENLRERRQMKEEEKQALAIRKQEEKLRKEMAERLAMLRSVNSNGNSNGNDNDNAALSQELLAKRDLSLSYEKRRKELKDLTLERRRRAEDQRLMILEDELSQQLREIANTERQKKAFIAEFGEDQDETLLEGSSKEALTILQSDILLSAKLLSIPDWLEKTLPRNFYTTLSIFQQNQYIKQRIVIHEKEKVISKKHEREEKRLFRLEKKAFKEWDIKMKLLEQITRKSELLMIESKEELTITENKVITISENITKLQLFCREIGEKELHLTSIVKKLKESYHNLQEEYEEASDWYTICCRRNKNRDKLKRKVVSNCKFIDSESINGFFQRFETHRLRERVYMSYFLTIVEGIVNRAEMIASERKLFFLQHELSENKYFLINRNKGMQSLLRELKCSEYLRMRRSLLTEKFFPKNRKTVLSSAIEGWIRYYFWNKGNENAYKMKFAIIKRQLEINRQFAKSLGTSQALIPASATAGDDTQGAIPEVTLMSRIRERVLECKHCLHFYLAAQNHSLACAYHPSPYLLACPETCPSPGLTALCSVHRKKRWGCCYLTDANAMGCARRYHTPPDSDPLYDYIMDKINERDAATLEEIDREVTVAREANYPDRLESVRKTQLLAIEEELETARKTAARFKNLKFV